jgi:hypothetical protein
MYMFRFRFRLRTLIVQQYIRSLLHKGDGSRYQYVAPSSAVEAQAVAIELRLVCLIECLIITLVLF